MPQAYKTPTLAQDWKIVDCIADDLKPMSTMVRRAALAINEKLISRGIKPKRIEPHVKSMNYKY